MFEEMTITELRDLFDKIFKEYYEKSKKFREEGEDLEPEDIKAGSDKWKQRFKESLDIVRLGNQLSEISKQLREKRKSQEK